MYKALYRKWRPLLFDDVISQQHITDTLKNQLKSDKTAHAYLFTGSRGTGKTTCARILAKAVNCKNMKNGSPCLECDICLDTDNNALSDIIEIDAASNNGVDDIRDLRDGTVYTPERCSYKVYIIDEVHMLSASAFNALLKIMEEPPPYIKFILATTEIHKVPATIVSRCQRYDFRRIKAEDIAKRLLYIAKEEELTLTQDGAELIAKLADGGMRDALSLLDQCSVCAEKITAAEVSAVAGIAGRDYLYEILEAVSAGDAVKAISVTDTLNAMSKDLVRLCDELIMQLRNLMLIKLTPETASELIVCSPEEMQRLKQISEDYELPQIMEKIDVLQQCREKMNRALNRRIELEMALIKLCRNIPANVPIADNSDVLDKIRQLETRLQSARAATQPENPTLTAVSEELPPPNVDLKNSKPEDFKSFEAWSKVLTELKRLNPAITGPLDDSEAKIYGNVILIFVKNSFFTVLFKNKDNLMSLHRAVYNVTGQKCTFRTKCVVTAEEQRNRALEVLNKANNSGIETAVE